MKEITTSLSTRKSAEINKEVISEHRIFADDYLILIEAESLSLNDSFMKHKSKTKAEEEAKRLIIETIEAGIKNFYRPNMDPSFTNDGIEYVIGKKPAIGNSYNWWVVNAEKYHPSRNSRLGTRLEYGAFLGVLIKKLVEEGKSVEWAWNAVCNDSRELGHYRNSSNAKRVFELTGSRCICGFFDLANTYKVFSEDVEDSGYWLAGGACNFSSYDGPLASLYHSTVRTSQNPGGVGWIVLS